MLITKTALVVDLKQPRTLRPPKEYEVYCARHNIDCVNGEYVNFANFNNNIDTIREVFEANKDDTFFFKTIWLN